MTCQELTCCKKIQVNFIVKPAITSFSISVKHNYQRTTPLQLTEHKTTSSLSRCVFLLCSSTYCHTHIATIPHTHMHTHMHPQLIIFCLLSRPLGLPVGGAIILFSECSIHTAIHLTFYRPDIYCT